MVGLTPGAGELASPIRFILPSVTAEILTEILRFVSSEFSREVTILAPFQREQLLPTSALGCNCRVLPWIVFQHVH